MEHKKSQKSQTPQKYDKGLFIFHRDFRLTDNIGLLEACSQCKELYLCFIFTPDQVGKTNSYRSLNAIQFMIESLEELSTEIEKQGGELLIFYDKQPKVIEQFIKNQNIQAVFFNKDYTPYAVERDNESVELCKKNNIDCNMFSDYYLLEPGTITTGSGKDVYKKYTPFYDAVLNIKINKPLREPIKNIVKKSSNMEKLITLEKANKLFINQNSSSKQNPNILVNGGRNEALNKLKLALTQQKEYDETRDYFMNNTTFLSAYIKFGCVSIREVYHSFKDKFGLRHGLIRELLWREFFAHILYAYPETMVSSYKFKDIHWRNSKIDYEKWCNGETGFPTIDAFMRQMNQTGFMHNRGRMAVANFLTKTLLLDWRLGAKYFAQKLTDYDVASNQGNWQSVASTGVYGGAYFRDMNPWIQSKKFDKEGEFIKKWIPELKDVEPRDIHKWDVACREPKYKDVKYNKPMVDYSEQKEKMLALYGKK
jgi:deoxyribodipyrimidine photo-lyase